MRSFLRPRNLLLIAVFLFFPGKLLRFAALLVLVSDAAALMWSRSLERSLSAVRTAPRLCINRHERLELSLIVENRSRFPALSCLVRDSSDIPGSADRDARWLCTVRSGARIVLSYSVLASERGAYSAGPVSIRCCDPLGRYPFTIELPVICPVLVRPARIEYAPVLRGGIPQGLLPVRNPAFEDVSLVRSARAYRSGDEMRRINWKMSARFGSLVTNEFLETRDCPAFVFLDLSYSRFPERHKSELAETLIELAAALVRSAEQNRQQCGFASQDYYIKPAKNMAATILDILAVIDVERKSSPPGSISVGGVERGRALLARSLAALPSGASFFFVGPQSPDLDGRFEKEGDYVWAKR